MSRTYRKPPKVRGKIRDGADFRPSRACRHNGPCAYCEGNRTHNTRKREPIE